jgi:ribosomal protein S18 acetylase RimI-like enzyme
MAEVSLLRPDALTEAMPRLVEIYAAAFSEPPHVQSDGEPERFRAVLADHRMRDGFLLAAASEDDELHGFAYGYPGGPGEWWHDRVAAAIDPAQAAHWLAPGYLEVVELAVAPSHQRRGLGESLLDTLTASSGASCAVLSTRVDAPALDFYARRNWQAIGELRFAETGPVYVILARDLRPGG